MFTTIGVLALEYSGAGVYNCNSSRRLDGSIMDILLFFTGISAIVYMSYKLGKDRGTMLASERAVDMMIAMGYLKERADGEIEKVHNEKSN